MLAARHIKGVASWMPGKQMEKGYGYRDPEEYDGISEFEIVLQSDVLCEVYTVTIGSLT